MRQRIDLHVALDLIEAIDAGERVDPVDIHRAGPADALATGPAEGQRRVDLILDLDESVQNHRAACVHVDEIGVDAGQLARFLIPAIDLEGPDIGRAFRLRPGLALGDLRVLRECEFSHCLRSSIHARLGRNFLQVDAALGLGRQRVEVDGAVRERGFAGRLVDAGDSVFAPFLVVATAKRAVLVVHPGVGAAAFLARLGADHGGHRVGHQVAKLQRLHQVGVPDQRLIRDLQVRHLAVDRRHIGAAFLQRFLGAEDGGVLLHLALHFQPQISGRDGAIGVARGVEPGHRLIDGGLIERAVRLIRVDNLARLDRRGAAKDNKVDQGVRSETVRPVDGGATRLAHRHQAGLEAIRVVRRRVQRLPPVIGRDAAHVVVDGRDDRDRLLIHVDAGENLGAFRNAGQAFSKRFRRQVVQIEVDMVAIGAHAAAFADFHRHAARNNVARGEILGGGRVAFHEPLALGIDEVSTYRKEKYTRCSTASRKAIPKNSSR